jgi:tetratricopeptide (TPR) repeat protein
MEPGIWSIILAMLLGWISNGQEGSHWLRLLVAHYRQQKDTWLLAFALENLGGLRMPSGRGSPQGRAGLAESANYLTEALEMFESLGDLREQGHSLRLLGLIYRSFDNREAKSMLINARRLLQEAGDHVMAANVGIQIAESNFRLGEMEEAFLSFRQLRRYYAGIGNQRFEAYALSKESMEAVRYSTIDHARETRKQSLAVSREARDLLGMAWSTWELGEVERVDGQLESARFYFEEAKSLFVDVGDPNGQVFYQRGLGDLAQELGQYVEAETRFEESLRLARQHPHLWAAAYALAGLGRATLGQNRLEEAHSFFVEGIELSLEHGYRELDLVSLAGLANHAMMTTQSERALQLSIFVLSQPLTWNETRKQVQVVLEAIRGEFDESRIESVETWAMTMTLEEVADLAS